VMKPEQDDRLEPGGDLSKLGEFSLERLLPPQIVGQMDNPVLERMRRLWWRVFDRVCGYFAFISCRSMTEGLRADTPDMKRDDEHDRLFRLFPAAAETIELRKCDAGQIRTAE
jgi:hypothetical protein